MPSLFAVSFFTNQTQNTMIKSQVEYYFLKRSIEQFGQNLHKMSKIIPNKVFGDNELLELMHNLVTVKEIIESLEVVYSEM
ncbi:MAG: hypothetical protein ACJA02_000764 [Myxococcota bacterium]|jgi:hypothetical protein